MRDRTLRGAVFYAIVHAYGETIHSLAGYWITPGTEPNQSGHVRAPTGRQTGRIDDKVLQSHPEGIRFMRKHQRPNWGIVPSCLPRQN